MDLYEVLIKKIEEKKQMFISAAAQGSAKDFAEYQHLCGRIRGLTDAQIVLNDLLQQLKEKDED